VQKLLRFILLSFLMLTPWVSFAQGVTGLDEHKLTLKKGTAFRAGMNYSSPMVTAVVATPTLYVMGVTPGYGFYLGEFFYKDLIADKLMLRVDATFQAKGSTINDINGRSLGHADYFYLGLTPQLGLHLANKLTAFTGVEVNKLVATKKSWGAVGTSFELGTTIRLNYRIRQFAAELSYFRAFTRFDRLDGIQPEKYNDFYNKNVQFGLIYYWARKD